MQLVMGRHTRITAFSCFEKKISKTDLDIWLVFIAHGKSRELGAEFDHGIVEYGWKSLIIIEPLNGLFDEVEADSILIYRSPQEIRGNSIIVFVWLAAGRKSIRYERYLGTSPKLSATNPYKTGIVTAKRQLLMHRRFDSSCRSNLGPLVCLFADAAFTALFQHGRR